VVVADMQANGGLITLDDLANYSVCERDPVRGQYRGYDILSAAPPSSGGTHILQMLNLLSAFPIGHDGLGFGEPGYVHLLAETLKIAFADRRQHMADPDRVHVPVAELISAAYADRRRAEIERARSRSTTPPGSFRGGTFHGG
jgi:gamma-glutamyltranspeptidase / glutathione hydrolase